MRNLIPLNSLVLTVGPTPTVNRALADRYFEGYEIISAEDIRFELVGDRTRRDIDAVVFSEIHRRIQAKLSLGERVVVVAQNLRKDSRVTMAEVGIENGVPVYYLVCEDENAAEPYSSKFANAERDVWRGDGLAEIINPERHHDVVKKYQGDGLLEYIRAKYQGITVLGDVHGMYQSLLTAVDWARQRNHFVLSLGDIIDYGPGSLETADELYRLVMRGSGEMILGNHERKIARWLDQNERGRSMMKLSDGNKVTTQALNRAGAVARGRWGSRFRSLTSRAPRYLVMGDVVFAHAAIHPSMWGGDMIDAKGMENFCLFGEYDPTQTKGTERPARTYNWVKEIPAGKTVIVGHDCRSTTRPVIETNDAGGTAIFLDTGCGKGGSLTTVDLRFGPNGTLEIKNFTMI